MQARALTGDQLPVPWSRGLGTLGPRQTGAAEHVLMSPRRIPRCFSAEHSGSALSHAALGFWTRLQEDHWCSEEAAAPPHRGTRVFVCGAQR